jgi:hypothetical protein
MCDKIFQGERKKKIINWKINNKARESEKEENKNRYHTQRVVVDGLRECVPDNTL